MVSFKIPRMKDGRINKNRLSNEQFEELYLLTPFIEDKSLKTTVERIFCIQNNILSAPLCLHCGKRLIFKRCSYPRVCSKKCFYSSEIIKMNRKNTCLERYGVENPSQSEEIKQKKIDTCLSNYGVEFPFQSEKIRLKSEETCFERYGVSHTSKLESSKEKSKKTCLKRYGVEFISQQKEWRNNLSISLANNFRERRNAEGTDFSGIVYIIHFPHLMAVKIGLSGDFEARRKDLLRDFGEFSIIELFETDYCFKLENELHEKFEDFRICLSEGTGRTEFFKEEILKGNI